MGNPRWRPVKAAPRPCDFGRTSEKPDFACKEADGKPAEGTHRWNTAGGAEVNLCDPHDAEAKRGTGDITQPRPKVVDRQSRPIQ